MHKMLSNHLNLFSFSACSKDWILEPGTLLNLWITEKCLQPYSTTVTKPRCLHNNRRQISSAFNGQVSKLQSRRYGKRELHERVEVPGDLMKNQIVYGPH